MSFQLPNISRMARVGQQTAMPGHIRCVSAPNSNAGKSKVMAKCFMQNGHKQIYEIISWHRQKSVLFDFFQFFSILKLNDWPLSA